MMCKTNVTNYKELHASNASYGSGVMHLEYIKSILMALRKTKIIDFGCGKGITAKALNETKMFDCAMYDPSIPECSELPKNKFDALINTDVLEHIPEKQLNDVITVMSNLSDTALIIPHLDLAINKLPDGTNAHCTIKTTDEWQELLSQYWHYAIRLYHHSSKHGFFLCSQENQQFEKLIILSGQIAGTEFQKTIASSLLRRINNLI